MKNIYILFAIIFFAVSCGQNEAKKTQKPKYVVTKDEAKLWVKSNQVFKTLPAFSKDTSPQHLARIELGKKLYYEKKLSKMVILVAIHVII